MRLALSMLVLTSLVGCGGSTTEPARTEPQRVEAVHDDPAVTSTPRRLEAPRDDEGSASSPGASAPIVTASPSGAARGHRPTVPPPPVEPPTF